MIIHKYIKLIIFTTFFFASKSTALYIHIWFDLGNKVDQDKINAILQKTKSNDENTYASTIISIDESNKYMDMVFSLPSSIFEFHEKDVSLIGWLVNNNKEQKEGSFSKFPQELSGNLGISLAAHYTNSHYNSAGNQKTILVVLSFSFPKNQKQKMNQEIQNDNNYYHEHGWKLTQTDDKDKTTLTIVINANKHISYSQGTDFYFHSVEGIKFEPDNSSIRVPDEKNKDSFISVPFSGRNRLKSFIPPMEKQPVTSGIENVLLLTFRYPSGATSFFSLPFKEGDFYNDILKTSSESSQSEVSTNRINEIHSGFSETILFKFYFLALNFQTEAEALRLDGLKSLLKSMGYQLVNSPGDHYCMFHAIANWFNRFRPNLDNVPVIYQNAGVIENIRQSIISGPMNGMDIFNYFSGLALALAAQDMQDGEEDSAYIRLATLFTETPGPAIWADQNVLTDIFLPLTNRPVLVLGVQQAAEDNFSGELYENGIFTVVNTIDDLVHTLRREDIAIFIHYQNHWELVLRSNESVQAEHLSDNLPLNHTTGDDHSNRPDPYPPCFSSDIRSTFQ